MLKNKLTSFNSFEMNFLQVSLTYFSLGQMKSACIKILLLDANRCD
jgi:hypothetical protein